MFLFTFRKQNTKYLIAQPQILSKKNRLSLWEGWVL